MDRKLTQSQAKAFQKRWKAVNAVSTRELRKMPIARKFQQLGSLMAWGTYFGWTEPQEDGVEEVRKRWNRLFQIYRG